MNLELKVEGTKELIAAFEKVQDGVADLRKNAIWFKVQQAAYKEIKAQFAGEGIGPSGKWKELSSPYKEYKAKKYGDVPILQASGRLWKSLTRENDDAVVDKQPLEMTLGTTVPYAKYHQSKEPRKKIPFRPFWDFTNEQKERIATPVVDGLKQLIANARLKG